MTGPGQLPALPPGGRRTVLASFVIMLCLGGIYTWSVFVPGLRNDYHFTLWQTQLVFGLVIGIFPLTMIVAGRLQGLLSPRWMAYLSALLFASGYLLAAYSGGSFLLVLLGIGILAGIGTGLGYLASLTTPVKWFPRKKGLVTGIVAAGFGLGAVMLSGIADLLFTRGWDVLQVFAITGLLYGLLIILVAGLLKLPHSQNELPRARARTFMKTGSFYRLFLGIFSGTFAGLLVIGNLAPMGAQYQIDSHLLIIGVSVFALANFLGRLLWGFVSDFTGAPRCIFFALMLQALAILLMGYLQLNEFRYLALAFLTGFGFGGNFVLFARQTSQQYGLDNLGYVYPYVFLGYALAGILGPLTGGLIYDHFMDYSYAKWVAGGMSGVGAGLFLIKN